MENSALVAMSGGVDSSVAAFLMQQAGYRCGGAIMELWKENASGAAADAKAVADRLGMPFHILDASASFRQQVVDYFIRSYEEGLTPNPCVQCNRHLKFSYFLEAALSMGYDSIVTGHYATIRKDEKSGAYRRSYEYEISNFKHFQELLKERENIEISYSALYNILRKAGIKSPKKHRKK